MGVDTGLGQLEIRQIDVAYYATIDPPAFGLGGRWIELQHAIYSHLGRFKLSLNDIKVESTSANPADLSIGCWLLSSGALTRFRLDRVEVWSNRQAISSDPGLMKDIVTETMNVLRAVCPESRVVLHSASAAIHGALSSDVDVASRIAAFVTSGPGGTPAWAASGVSFVCELPSGTGKGLVVLERSAVLPDGAFLRIASEHPGSLSEAVALDGAKEFFREATARLAIDLVWSK